MRRWTLVGLLLALVTSPTALLWLAGDESCACVRAACCCGSTRPAADQGCHALRPGVHRANLRCRHVTQIRVPVTAGALPPAEAQRPAERQRQDAEWLPPAPRDGFTRVESPPPRDPALLS